MWSHRSFCMSMAMSAVVACALLAASQTASGNPVPMPTEWEGTPLLVGLVLIFLMNLPLNTFWYSLVVLALSRARMLEFTRVPAYVNGALASKVLGAAVLVSGLGAVIDVFSGEDDIFWFRELGEATLVAAALVFASVLIASMAIPRLKAVQSFILAAAIASMNLVHWIVIAEVFYGDGTSSNPAPYVVAYGIICAVLSVVVYKIISRTEPSDACAVVEPREEA